ncbi:hypothetical protein NSND_50395 [Nitrospira sp. ND1]|nr:hypothetical protein NSND_50395 [Nitrospira sp. ND1]
MRVTVRTIVGLSAAGNAIQEVLGAYPSIEWSRDHACVTENEGKSLPIDQHSACPNYSTTERFSNGNAAERSSEHHSRRGTPCDVHRLFGATRILKAHASMVQACPCPRMADAVSRVSAC